MGLGILVLLGLFCVGWHELIQEDMLLGGLGNKIRKLPMWLAKPLGECVGCSASLIGGLGLILLMFIPYGIVPIILVALIGVNFMLLEGLNYIRFKNELMGYKVIKKRQRYGKTDSSMETEDDNNDKATTADDN